MVDECGKCNVQMQRIGLEETTERGIVIFLECPSCHAKKQKIVFQRKPWKLEEHL